jgi:hypothetical protein
MKYSTKIRIGLPGSSSRRYNHVMWKIKSISEASKMKTLLFSEFYKGNYDEVGYELYLVRDTENNVMYVGISRDSVWHRWFDGGTSHMDSDANGNLYGKSYIGEVIERRFPTSWEWTIELWTKEDCLKICGERIKGRNLHSISIESLEPYMIHKFEPLYNIAHGGGRHEDPLITNKLDKLYKDIFG